MADEQATETAQADTEAAKGAETTANESTGTDTTTKESSAAGQKAEETPAKEEVKPTAPEKYELKLPEGSLLDASSIERISAYAKEKGLSNEDAQELLNRENGAVAAHHEAQMKQVEEMRAEWLKAAETDKEYGGKEFKKNAELAHRAFARFSNPEDAELLKESGLGNHPVFIRWFYRVGKAMAEDSFIHPGSKAAGGKKSIEDVFYGDSNKTI